MAADEHQPQHVVLDMINRAEEVLFRHLAPLPASHGGVDLIKAVAAPGIDRLPALGDRHQPGAGVIGIRRIVGHCCNRLRARPERGPPLGRASRTIRTSPAISLVDSRRQTASMACCVVASVTGRSDHDSPSWRTSQLPCQPGRVIFVNLHQPFRQLDGLRLAPYLDHGVPPTSSLASVNGPSTALIVPSTRDTMASAAALGGKPPWSTSGAISGTLRGVLAHRLEQLRRRWPTGQ